MKKMSEPDYQKGQGFVEYALLIALVVIGVILVLTLGGVSLSDLYCSAANAIGGGEACNEQQAYCQDNFDGDLSGWQSTKGDPSQNNGQMCFGSETQSMNRCSMEIPQSDYVIKMEDVTLSKGNGYGVFFRSTIDKHGLDGYAFQYDPGLKSAKYPNGAFVIRRWVNGREVWNPIAISPMGTDVFNTPHDFEITVKGDTFTIMMDGKQILSAKDGAYKTGGTGIRSWDSTSACMGDFSVNETP